MFLKAAWKLYQCLELENTPSPIITIIPIERQGSINIQHPTEHYQRSMFAPYTFMHILTNPDP